MSEQLLVPLKHVMNSFPDADDVQPLSRDDYSCLEEVREVLRRHNCLQKFGITLLHKHFDVGSNEILLESTDVKERTQIIRPVQREELPGDDEMLETAWCLLDGEILMACKLKCVKSVITGHTKEHVKTSAKS